jgi:tRNA-dihydrouridine synthase
MNKAHFWSTLSKPIKVLAPMENVTDTVFRQFVGRCAPPDVYFTEFTNVDWLCGSRKLREQSMHRLEFSQTERPLVAQLWGSEPENFYKVSLRLQGMGLDGIDINMGCPAPKIRRKLSCSGLIRDPSLASEIIRATQEGAGSLPVSVKTRLGLERFQTEEWCGFLLQHQLDALIVHARIAKDMSRVPARWEELHKVVALRNQIHPATILIGNGDVMSLEELHQKHRQYGVDGVMIGRGIFHDLFFFHPEKHLSSLSAQEKIDLLLAHAQAFVEKWGERKDFDILKKFFKIYTTGWDGALELREKLMTQKNLEGVHQVIAAFGYRHPAV